MQADDCSKLPSLAHHQIKVGVVINRRTDPRIVVHKFIESNLGKENINNNNNNNEQSLMN